VVATRYLSTYAPVGTMNYGVLFEKISDPQFPEDFYYAHLPALGLTTHGKGVEGAREALRDLLELWVAEKRANGESMPAVAEHFFSTIEVPDDALQGA
jgi:predicted RNase H-like HicB family nuclease